MCKILHFLITIICLECIFLSKIEKSGSLGIKFFTFVEGKQFNNDEIQQTDIYCAELSTDIKTRLYQILNKSFQYHRYTLDNVDKKEKRDENLDFKIYEDLILNDDEQFASDDEMTADEDINFNDNIKLENSNRKSEIRTTVKSKKTTTIKKTSKFTKISKNSTTKVFSTKFSTTRINTAQTSFKKSTTTKINTAQTSFKKSTTTKINTTQTSFKKSTLQTYSSNNKGPSSFYHGINVDDEKIFNINNGINTSTPFHYKIKCLDDEKTCNYIEGKLKHAGDYISKIFNIYNTIAVDVQIVPFCKYMGGDNCSSITALTNPPSFVTLNITGHGIFSYPQALVKQLNIGSIVKKIKSNDISLYFNTDYLKENDYGNYLLVAAHELIHGMGFFHLMTTANAAFKVNFPQDLIIPQPVAQNYRTSNGEEWSYKGWIPFTVFDRYIVEVNKPNVYIYKGIAEYLEDTQAHKLTSEEKIIEHFDNIDISFDTQNYSRHLVSPFTTQKALGFRAYDGEVITLQTFKEYEPMSSVSHIHSPFSCDSSINCFIPKEKMKDVDENYLMYYTIITRSTNDLVNKYSKDSEYGFIGSKIVKILKTMGWTENKDKTRFKEYEDNILSHETSLNSSLRSTYTSTPSSSTTTNTSKKSIIFIMIYLIIFTLL